eukprot:7569900-Pyramimonas_sp.AAC.1
MRRRFFDGCSFETLQAQRKDCPSLDARCEALRKDRCTKAGEFSHQEKKPVEQWVAELESEFCEAYEEGAFYTLQQFCKAHKIKCVDGDADDTLTRRIRKTWPDIEISRDARLKSVGVWYVNDPNPNRGNYKFRRGVKSEVQLQKRQKPVDDELAAEAIADIKKAKRIRGMAPAAAGHVGGRARDVDYDVAMLSDVSSDDGEQRAQLQDEEDSEEGEAASAICSGGGAAGGRAASAAATPRSKCSLPPSNTVEPIDEDGESDGDCRRPPRSGRPEAQAWRNLNYLWE